MDDVTFLKLNFYFQCEYSTEGDCVSSFQSFLPYHWAIQSFMSPQSFFFIGVELLWGFPGGSVVKNLPAGQEPQEMWVQSLGQEDPLEEEMATHSSILAWRMAWTGETGELRATGSQRVRHD